MKGMGAAYQAAQTASYKNRKDTLSFRSDTIRRWKIAGTPLACAARVDEEGRNVVAWIHYWQPRVDVLTEVSKPGAKVRRFQRTAIHGCDFFGWEGELTEPVSVRLLPDEPPLMSGGDKVRGHGLTWGPNGSLWMSRNGDGVVFEMTPPAPGTTRWVLKRKFLVTEKELHSIYLDPKDNTLFTIESTLDQMASGQWKLVSYNFDGSRFSNRTVLAEVPHQTYALTSAPNDHPWYGVDIRSSRRPGIYVFGFEDAPTVTLPGIGVNGLAFLPDGSAFATFYGESSVGNTSALGSPSELIYLPASEFDR